MWSKQSGMGKFQSFWCVVPPPPPNTHLCPVTGDRESSSTLEGHLPPHCSLSGAWVPCILLFQSMCGLIAAWSSLAPLIYQPASKSSSPSSSIKLYFSYPKFGLIYIYTHIYINIYYLYSDSPRLEIPAAPKYDFRVYFIWLKKHTQRGWGGALGAGNDCALEKPWEKALKEEQ